jgi:hypothetical protein
MPRGIARSEPIGMWRAGATAAERVQAARRWASKLLQGTIPWPPFHGGKPATEGRLS